MYGNDPKPADLPANLDKAHNLFPEPPSGPTVEQKVVLLTETVGLLAAGVRMVGAGQQVNSEKQVRDGQKMAGHAAVRLLQIAMEVCADLGVNIAMQPKGKGVEGGPATGG